MKKKSIKSLVSIILLAGALGGCQSMMNSMGMIPMGSSDDVADANALWKVLKKENLVGINAKREKVYMGTPPHGKVLETLHQKIRVNGHTGTVIVKRNYGGPGVSISKVEASPAKYLKAVTVMFKREKGYDAEDKDWFYAKFKPNGSLHVKEKMMMEIALAGRVAKGKPMGCIACHQGAPGGDFVFAEGVQ